METQKYKQKWSRHSLRKNDHVTARNALEWNRWGAHKNSRMKVTCRRTVLLMRQLEDLLGENEKT